MGTLECERLRSLKYLKFNTLDRRHLFALVHIGLNYLIVFTDTELQYYHNSC